MPAQAQITGIVPVAVEEAAPRAGDGRREAIIDPPTRIVAVQPKSAVEVPGLESCTQPQFVEPLIFNLVERPESLVDASIECVATIDNYQILLAEWSGVVNSDVTLINADGSTMEAEYGFFLGSLEFSGE
jgi:hypothetical protein